MATALITGATSGLGDYLARQLAADKFRVLVHGRDEVRCARLAKELTAQGFEAIPVVADLASLQDVKALGDEIAATEPQLDVLINNAGAGLPPGTPRELSEDG